MIGIVSSYEFNQEISYGTGFSYYMQFLLFGVTRLILHSPFSVATKQQDIVKSIMPSNWCPYLVAYIITEKHIAALPESKDNSSTLYTQRLSFESQFDIGHLIAYFNTLLSPSSFPSTVLLLLFFPTSFPSFACNTTTVPRRIQLFQASSVPSFFHCVPNRYHRALELFP